MRLPQLFNPKSMAWFCCVIHGVNFPGVLIDSAKPVGFFTARFVEAANTEQAEILGLQILREEPKLALPKGDKSQAAQVSFDEIYEVSPVDVPSEIPGFIWHTMEDGE